MLKLESIKSKIQGETNFFKVQFLIIKYYINWFIFTFTGRFLLTIALIASLTINIVLHETRPAAKLNKNEIVKMKKLEKELVKINTEIPKNEMIDPFDHSVHWQSKELPFLRQNRQKIINKMRILKNEAFVKNGFESWQNRLMNALPRIWILNSHLKKLSYNQKIIYKIREEKRNANTTNKK